MLIMDETQESKTSRPSGVAWTFRIRWDDSQAIIRTWQILPWRLPAVDFRDFTMAECFLGVLQGAELQRTDLLVHVCVLYSISKSGTTKLYGVATLSFEALTPRKRMPQHRKNKYQNISKYPCANYWLDLTWSTLIRHVWLHWYMASYPMIEKGWNQTPWVIPAPLHLTLKVSLPFPQQTCQAWTESPSLQIKLHHLASFLVLCREERGWPLHGLGHSVFGSRFHHQDAQAASEPCATSVTCKHYNTTSLTVL